MPVKTIIQWRRSTAATWTSTNPVLAIGEAGYETDTKRFKLGDGTSTWSTLSYFESAIAFPDILNPFLLAGL